MAWLPRFSLHKIGTDGGSMDGDAHFEGAPLVCIWLGFCFEITLARRPRNAR